MGIACATVLVAFLTSVVPAGGEGVPETTITSGPTGVTKDKHPTFTFSSNQPGSTFMCKIDHTVGPFACTSPFQFPPRGDGDHFFEVYAISGGASDPTPATAAFTIDTSAPSLRIDKQP